MGICGPSLILRLSADKDGLRNYLLSLAQQGEGDVSQDLGALRRKIDLVGGVY